MGAIVAGLVVVGIGGYFGYRMLFGNDSSSRIATSEPTPSTSPAPAPEPPKDTSASPQPPAQDSASMQSMPAAMPPDTEAKPAGMDATQDANNAGSKTDSTKAPGMAASTKDSGKAPPAKASNPPVSPGSSPSTTDAPKTVAQAGNPGQQVAQTDRWKLMKDAMSKCVGETFFKRVACEQSVGLQYCEGYWGKVPQCPSGPSKDRGQ